MQVTNKMLLCLFLSWDFTQFILIASSMLCKRYVGMINYAIKTRCCGTSLLGCYCYVCIHLQIFCYNKTNILQAALFMPVTSKCGTLTCNWFLELAKAVVLLKWEFACLDVLPDMQLHGNIYHTWYIFKTIQSI